MNRKGIDFARVAQALAVAGPGDAAAWAAHRWGQDSKAALVTKAAVGGASTDSHSALDMQVAAADFLELVRAESVIGRLPGLRRIPHNVPYLKATGTASAHWVAEGKAAPISNASFARDSMNLLKLAAVSVITDELLASPDADRILRDEMVAACREALDAGFIDPTNAGVAGEEPASITNGITPIVGSGDFSADLDDMVSAFGGDLSRAVIIGKPQLFVQMYGTAYPNIGARGGELAGIPAIATNGMPNDESGNYQLALIDPGAIAFAGGESAELKTTQAAAIEMSDAPTGDTLSPVAATSVVSLFQVNATAIMALIRANWERQRDDAVVVLNGLVGAESAS